MKFLPFEHITYRTKLSPDEIMDILPQYVEPRKKLRWKGVFANKNHKPYEGHIGVYSFDINRIIHHKNSFLPQIKGRVNLENRDIRFTEVSIEMRLHTFVLIFSAVWLSVVSMAFFGVTITTVSEWLEGGASLSQMPFESFIPAFMLVFFYGMVIFSFNRETRKAKQFLVKILNAEAY